MSLFDEVLDEYLSKVGDEYLQELSMLQEDYQFIQKPVKIGDYLRTIKAYESLISRAESIPFNGNIVAFKDLLLHSFDEKKLAYSESKIAIDNKFIAMGDNVLENYKIKAKLHNDALLLEAKESNSRFDSIEEKRKALEKYSNIIVDTCSAFGITSSDISVDASTFTLEELDKLYGEYIPYMEKYGKRVNPIEWYKEKVPNEEQRAVTLVIFLVLAFTPIFDIAVVALFSYMIYNQIKAKSKVKTFMLLYGLLFNINPYNMPGYNAEVDESLLMPEEMTEEMEDSDPELASIITDWENELYRLGLDPEEANYSLLTDYNNSANDTINLLKNKEMECRTKTKEFIDELLKLIEQFKEEYERESANIKLLGQEVSTSEIFDTNFRLGLKNGIEEEFVNIGLSNVIIKPVADKVLMQQFIQCMLANAFCNVAINKLNVTIFDPNNSCRDVIQFYKPEFELIFKFCTDKLDTTIKELKDIASKNMKIIGAKTINQFNQECVEVGRTTREYHLLIILSQPKTVEEDEALTEFMKYSADHGVMIWMITNRMIANTFVFNKPFEGVANPYPIDLDTFGTAVADVMLEAKIAAKPPALLWENFIKVAIPEENIWTYVSDQFLNLDPGFVEGDPTQFRGYTVGNEGDIHAITVGGTGAGKSVFLNNLIANLTRKYSPLDLELWLIDYKGAEFKFYLKSEEHPHMLPHIKACLCTSDGDYAGSLYKAIRKVAEDRYKFLMDKGFKNIKDFNKNCRKNGNLEDVIPRILILNDEFQVIFKKAEDKIKDQFTKDLDYIATVARACGIHLLFASQDMTGTVPAATLNQFTLRFGLRCAESVSLDIMRAKTSSSIKEEYGFLYVKSQADLSPESQKRYRTPFIGDDVLRAHIKDMEERALASNFKYHNVISYDESTIHTMDDLSNFYDVNSEKMKEIGYGTFILGERMTYSSNIAPVNVQMQAMNNTHIFSAFSDNEDLVNFYKTIMYNISRFTTDTQVFINSQVADLHYICELDVDVEESMMSYSNEKKNVGELYALFQGILEIRIANNEKESPLYVILIGWDKAVGFGIDKDIMLMSNVAKMLQMCGEYNMHFIFINSNIGAISEPIVNSCIYRIAGRVDEKTSYAVLDNKQGSKTTEMENGYMYINVRNDITRAKIYKYDQTREIKKLELVL